MSSVNLHCKVVLLGDNFVGKSCLMLRYIHGIFPNMVNATIGASMVNKKEQIDNKEVILEIWDTAGNKAYDSLTPIYYRKANAVIICYDVTSRESFDKACYWSQEVSKTEKSCKMYLCETKKDLVDENQRCREVDVTTLMTLAEEHKADIYETSSKTGENVDVLFKKIAQDYVAAKHSMQQLDMDDSTRLLRDRTSSIRRVCQVM